MADREQEVQRSVQPAGGSSEQGGAQATPDARMNIMRQRRAAAMRKGEGKGGAAPEVNIPEGGGAPLEGKTKQTMEKKLGADLSSVRIHTGGDSEGAAEKLNAQAFTVGNDVHFGAGKLDPGSKEGTKLLAHELTHVVQGQKGGVQKAESEGEGEEKEAEAEGKDGEALEVSDPEEPAEQEADAVAEQATEDLPNGIEGGGEAKGGEGEVAASEEKGEAETEEAAPAAAAKHNIGARSPVNASVLRKILRKKAFRDEEKAAAEAEAAPEAAAAAPAEDEKKEGEGAEGASSEGAAPEAAAAPPEASAAGAEGAAEEKKPEEEASAESEAPAAEGEEKVAAKRISAKQVARKINRKVFRDEDKAAEPEAAAAPEAAEPESEEKKAEGGAPEAASAEAAAPEGAAAPEAAAAATPEAAGPEGEEKKPEEEAPAAEAPAEEKVAAKRISAKRDTIQRKIFRAGPATPPPAAPAPQAKPPTQQEIDALPKGAVPQVGGVNNVTLDKGEVQGDKDLPDSVTVQQQAKTVSDKVKKYLKPETPPEERQALLAQITADFATLRTMMSEARGEGIDIIRLRTTFEKDIGAKATSGEFPGADAAVSGMVDKALSMIAGPQNQAVTAAETIAQKLEIMKQDPGLKAQIEALGTKIDIGFAGAVGKSFDAISGALSGGSLVQKCLALINFGDSFLKPKLTEKSPQVLAQIKENLSSAEFEALEAKIKTAQEAKAGAGAANAPGSTATDAEKKKASGADKEAQKQLLSDDGTFASKVNDKGAMDEKTPDLPVEALDPEALKHLCKTKGIDTEGQSPAQLVEKLKAAGVTTSGAANMADGAAGVTVQGMPFLQGIQANIVHPDHEWIANATKAEMPLKAGISGTTHRFLGLGNLLGVDDKPGMRLAMLGHLQAIEAHSFWEIVDASGMGQPAAGKYIPFAPVDDGQMTAAAKQTLAKDAQFAAKATGEGDQEAQAKRLLGTDKG